MTFDHFDINLNELSCCIDRSCSSEYYVRLFELKLNKFIP